MKHGLMILSCVLALSAAPAFATTCPTLVPASATSPEMRARFNAMVDELAAKAAARTATRQDFQRVVDEMRTIANEYMETKRITDIREKFLERMMELEQRAQQAQLMLMEFDVFKDLILDLDLQGIFQRTIDRARAGDVTRLQWTMYVEALQVRLDAAKAWNPEIDAIVGRLRAECERLEKRAGEAMKQTELAPFESLHADMMVQSTAARLSRRALEPIPGVRDPKGRFPLATQDFTDVSSTLIGTGVPESSELARKVKAKLDELRDAAQGGRITRAQFDELATLLLQRARAAVTSG
jgi:hypothetical protein